MSGDLPQRKPLRLRGYDYGSAGWYFVTFCTYERRPILSEVRRGDPCGRPELALTPLGQAAQRALPQLEALYGIHVESHVMMPNHVHLLYSLANERRATARVAPTAALVVGGLKSLAATQWLRVCKAYGREMGPLWQKGYYDHIVRDGWDFQRIWTYIENNPAKWREDIYYVI